MLMEECNIDQILDETKADIASCGKTFEQIGEESGLSRWWVSKFAQGRIPNPGIGNLVKLRNYLRNQSGKAA